MMLARGIGARSSSRSPFGYDEAVSRLRINTQPAYEAIIEAGAVSNAGVHAAAAIGKASRIFVITVANVRKHWGDALQQSLKASDLSVEFLEISDFILAAGVLGYVVGHYRLLGLLRNIVPVDPRRREGPPRWHFWRFNWMPRIVLERRSPRGVSPVEIPLLILTARRDL